MQTTKQKYKRIRLLREADILKRKCFETQETHVTNFDPITGKKLMHTKEIHCQAQMSEEHRRREAIAIEIKERQEAFVTLCAQTPLECQIKSNIFGCYLDDIHSAMLDFEKARNKLGLEWEEGGILNDAHIASVFLFDRSSDKLEGFHGHNCILACLWTWQEMVDFGKRPNFAKRHTDGQHEQVFMVEPRMISWYIFGCLLVEHVPLLKQHMRPEIVEHSQSTNFPRFVRLDIPEVEEHPVAAIFQYSFSLQTPPLLHVPTESTETARHDSTTAVNCDGPLAMLFYNIQIKEGIISQMRHRSLHQVPSEMKQKRIGVLSHFVNDKNRCIN